MVSAVYFAFQNAGFRAEDWKSGLEYATQHNWIEAVNPTTLRLTAEGFAEL